MILHGVDIVCLSLETSGITPVAAGMGTILCIVVSTLETGAFIIEYVCATDIRKCFIKAAKYAAVMQVARTKLNTAYQHVSKAMIDYKILVEEFSLITGRVGSHCEGRNPN